MRTIYKYKLVSQLTESFIKVPKGAIFLSLAVQHNEAVAYFTVDDQETRTQEIMIYAATTGGICPPTFFVPMGTAILNGGNYVLHYYYK